MLEIKKKTKAFALTGVILLVAGSMAYTLAWVTDSQKAKITSEEVLISKTDELMISLDNINYYGQIETSSDINFKNVSLKDFSGDGINLFSAIIDPYTKKAQNTGWQYIRTDENENISLEKKKILDANNKNKTYYSFDIYFKSATPLDVYLYKDSFIKPSSKEMNKTADTKKYCLFLRRTAKYDDDSETISYLYENEDGVLGMISADNKATFESTNLPEIYNRSTYGREGFDDDVDNNEFLEGRYTSVQTMYSTNYISASTRVAFIDDSKIEDPSLTEDNYDYKTIDTRLGPLAELDDYKDSRLRLLWAPNPEIRMTKTYNPILDGNAYDLDIVNLEETYLNSAGKKIGKSVTYPNGAKYYYKFTTVDDPSTESFLLFVKDDVKFDLDKNKITDVSATNVVDYNLLIQTTVSTTTNQSVRTGSRTIDGETVSDNRFYSYDGSLATLSSVPSQLFTNSLSTTENLDDNLNVCRLKKKAGTDYYEGKTTAVVWVEGSDPEASIALTVGNGEGLSEKSGIARIAYCLSFTGKEIPNTSEE